jgi:hypothetical protein
MVTAPLRARRFDYPRIPADMLMVKKSASAPARRFLAGPHVVFALGWCCNGSDMILRTASRQ